MQKLNKLVQIAAYSGPTFDLSRPSDRERLSQQIKTDIDQYCVDVYDGGLRSHLGASGIGHNCERYLYYKFRWFFKEETNGQKQRLFNRGHREEDRYLEWLQGIGCEILDADDEQTRMVAVSGHFGGSRDGTALLARYGISAPVLIEFKTHSHKGFKDLPLGGIRVNKPVHWRQMCTYGYAFNIKYGLYMNINKNDDELYVEVIEIDHKLGAEMIKRGYDIIHTTSPPARISENPSWFECSYCAAKHVCHENIKPLVNCRTCEFSEPVKDAEWRCSKWGSIIPAEVLPVGCETYRQRAQ